jgi:hypothetical protein
VALIYPKPQQGKRSTSSGTEKVSPARLSYAREIVRYPDLAYQVRGGKLKFDHALAEARASCRSRLNVW